MESAVGAAVSGNLRFGRRRPAFLRCGDEIVCEDSSATAWMGEESVGLLRQSVTAQGVKMTVAHEFETLNQAASALLVET